MLEITTESSFKADVLESEIPVLVDFWAEWCVPCKAMTPVLEAVAEKFDGKVKVLKLNVDTASAVAIAYGIRGIPTLVLFEKGQVVDKLVGAAPFSKVEALLAV
jgi:thioredoxin 1